MAKYKAPTAASVTPKDAPKEEVKNEVTIPVDAEQVAATDPVAPEAAAPVQEAPAEPAAAETPAQAPEAPVEAPKEAEAPAKAEKPAKEEKTEKLSPIDERAELMMEKGTTLEKVVAQTLRDYKEMLAPGNIISADVLNQQQLQLWRVIRLAIESSEDFRACYSFIIDFVRANQDGVFHDRYLYRGMDNISLDKDTATYFMASLNVIKLAATSKNKREAMAQVDLNRAMNENIFSEEGRNRVIAFFAQ